MKNDWSNFCIWINIFWFFFFIFVDVNYFRLSFIFIQLHFHLSKLFTLTLDNELVSSGEVLVSPFLGWRTGVHACDISIFQCITRIACSRRVKKKKINRVTSKFSQISRYFRRGPYSRARVAVTEKQSFYGVVIDKNCIRGVYTKSIVIFRTMRTSWNEYG